MTAVDRIVDSSRLETRWQGAVRLFGVLGFSAILGAGPILQILGPPVRTHAAVSAPLWSLQSFRDGDWMSGIERYLQEASPLTFNLRGYYNEVLLSWGLLDPTNVFLGSDDWMFMASTIHADRTILDSSAEQRRRTLASLARRCEDLGVKLLALPVPDKVRVYPEEAFPDGRLPPDKEGLYGLILREFEEAGIPCLNVDEVLRREKLAPTGFECPMHPEVIEETAGRCPECGTNLRPGPLFYQRDSHWTGHATLVVAHALQARLTELGWEDQLGEEVDLEPLTWTVLVVPDLMGTLGLRATSGVFDGTVVVMNGNTIHRDEWAEFLNAEEDSQHVSSLVRSLTEEKDYYRVWIAGTEGQPNLLYEESEHLGQVALAGTSFSEHCLRWALPYTLGRRVDTRGVVGAGGPFQGLQDQLGRIEGGESEAKILVWEMVERSYLEAEWRTPPIF